MRVLFQGAGAIGIAGAALFGGRHEVAVVSRSRRNGASAAFPQRVSVLEAPVFRGAEETNASTVAETRRVTVTDWAGIEAAGGFRLHSDTASNEAKGSADVARGSAVGRGVTIAQARRYAQRGTRRSARDRRVQDSWDLVVLTTRPGDLDEEVAAAIRAVAPRWVAITSQVDGDLDVARSLFPGTEVVVFGPAFLSERVDASPATPAGREVRYWSPFGAPTFLVAGPKHAVRRLSPELGSLVVPVPMKALLVSPAVFMPFVAELSVRGGDWEALLDHLDLPSAAASEAIEAAAGIRVPIVPEAARAVLEVIERISPISLPEYAGRHFARHEGQTLDMLDGWIARARDRAVLSELAGEMRSRVGES